MTLERRTRFESWDGLDFRVSMCVLDERGGLEFQFTISERFTTSPLSRNPFDFARIETHYAYAPKYMKEESPHHTDCQCTKSGICWHDDSSLQAQDFWLPGMKAHGTDWVWAELEKQHQQRFYNQEPPTIDQMGMLEKVHAVIAILQGDSPRRRKLLRLRRHPCRTFVVDFWRVLTWLRFLPRTAEAVPP